LNTKDFTYLLNKPYSLTERQTLELEAVLSEYPYLQSARAIQLKGLYNRDSYRYNTELKKAAAYTTDRSILFDFITTEQFQSIQKEFFEEKEKATEQIVIKESEEVIPVAQEEKPVINKLEESIKLSIKATEPKAEEQVAEEPEAITPEVPAKSAVEKVEESLDIGRPLEFDKTEKHSFQEWLQLSKLSPIKRDEEAETRIQDEEPEAIVPEPDEAKNKKLELIDKFIESNPKIVPSKTAPAPPVNIERSTQDTSYLMTETLARVYLEQKKYSKAIQAYEILILKYPEKSVFFADRISDIKLLQQNNN
jgi:hypothetical protein